jgi:hypothetical protein
MKLIFQILLNKMNKKFQDDVAFVFVTHQLFRQIGAF